MDQALELVGRSLYAGMGPTPDFLGYVPLATLKLVLVPSHSKNTHQVSHFLLYLFVAHRRFRALNKINIDDDRSDNEDEGENVKQD